MGLVTKRGLSQNGACHKTGLSQNGAVRALFLFIRNWDCVLPLGTRERKREREPSRTDGVPRYIRAKMTSSRSQQGCGDFSIWGNLRLSFFLSLKKVNERRNGLTNIRIWTLYSEDGRENGLFSLYQESGGILRLESRLFCYYSRALWYVGIN